MFFLFLMTFLGAAGNDEGWSQYFRFNIGLPINLYSGSTVVALLGALAFGGMAQRAFHAPLHRLYIVILILGAFCTLIGTVGMMMNGTDLALAVANKNLGSTSTNFILTLVCVFIGYRLLATPKAAVLFVYTYLISGIASVFVRVAAFSGHGASLGEYDTINKVRVNGVNTYYADIACVLLVYLTLARIRFWPAWLRFLSIAICLIGGFLGLNRSEWLGLIAALVGIFFFLPKGERLRQFFRSFIVFFVLTAGLSGAMFLASMLAHRDFFAQTQQRFLTMLPGYEDSHHGKAWDSRLPSIKHDWQVIQSNPFFGGGFDAQMRLSMKSGDNLGEFQHCAWTDWAAKMGVFGLSLMAILIFSPIIIGGRMVRDGVQRPYVLIGALGIATGLFFMVVAAGTLSVNTLRFGGMPVALLCGALLRARAMQLVEIRSAQTNSEPEGQYTDPSLGYAASVPAPAEGDHSFI